MKLKKLIAALAAVTLAAPGVALATNRYFSHGYGICKTMEMYTIRDKAFERGLEPYGAEPDVTRFVKEV